MTIYISLYLERGRERERESCNAPVLVRSLLWVCCSIPLASRSGLGCPFHCCSFPCCPPFLDFLYLSFPLSLSFFSWSSISQPQHLLFSPCIHVVTSSSSPVWPVRTGAGHGLLQGPQQPPLLPRARALGPAVRCLQPEDTGLARAGERRTRGPIPLLSLSLSLSRSLLLALFSLSSSYSRSVMSPYPYSRPLLSSLSLCLCLSIPSTPIHALLVPSIPFSFSGYSVSSLSSSLPSSPRLSRPSSSVILFPSSLSISLSLTRSPTSLSTGNGQALAPGPLCLRLLPRRPAK